LLVSGHCGIISRRSKVVIVASHASAALFNKTADGEYTCSDGEAMLSTIRLRFETHFDVHDRLIMLDATQSNCPGIRALKTYLGRARDYIVSV
jgi:hypothetical protein